VKRVLSILGLILLSVLLMAPIPPQPHSWYETQGEKHWFVTADGTGNCLSWRTSCTFRTAVSKCTDDYQDVIWLSPEDHDTDNGSDATGTTIAAKNVRIVGISNEHSFNARLYNTAAVVTHVVQVTGHRVSFENIRFNQMNQADLDVILLHISAPRTNIILCQFRGVPGSSTDVGILIDNTSRYHYMSQIHFEDFQDAAIRTNDVNSSEFDELHFHDCNTAIDMTHADDDSLEFTNVDFIGSANALVLAAGVDNIRFVDTLFVHNTTNVTDGGTWGGLHFIGVRMGHNRSQTYPANAGVAVAGGGGAWAQGALVQIVPAATIATPFSITGFNIQSATANNIYKVEFFWGQATGDNSLGIYEFVDVGGKSTPPPVDMGHLKIPSNSYVGAKLASSTGGDAATITINYEAL